MKKKGKGVVRLQRKNISAWKARLLRSVNQEVARQDTLDNLNQEGCLITMDSAMKFLPYLYRRDGRVFLESAVEVGT